MRAGAPILDFLDNQIERDIALADIAVKEKKAQLAYLRHRQPAELEKAEAFTTVATKKVEQSRSTSPACVIRPMSPAATALPCTRLSTARYSICHVTTAAAFVVASQALAMKSGCHVVVLRCSVPPGTTLDVVAAQIETASGRTLGDDFGVCFNPEFLREGVAITDFFEPPKTDRKMGPGSLGVD